jgi:hypothetical protein
MNMNAIRNLLIPAMYGAFARCDAHDIVVDDGGITLEASAGGKVAKRRIDISSLEDKSYKAQFRPMCVSMRSELGIEEE